MVKMMAMKLPVDPGSTTSVLILLLLTASIKVAKVNGSGSNSILENCEEERVMSPSSQNGDISLSCHLRTIYSEFDKTNLTNLPGDLVVKLQLDCSDILFYQSSLPKSSLSSLRRLASLHIEHCKLSRISPGVFAGLSELRNLTVRTHNTAWPALSLDIAPGVFNGLSRLEKIDISSNNIWTFPENTFCGTSKTLRILNIAQNRLQDISALSFNEGRVGGGGSSGGGRSSIKKAPSCSDYVINHLDVSHNRLVVLPPHALAKLSLLRELHLEGNEISVVASEAFARLSLLKVLNLSHNKVENLPAELFQQNGDIEQIYFENNSLNAIPPGLFANLNQLVILDLSRNKLSNSNNNNNKNNGNNNNSSSSSSSLTFSGLIRLVNLNLSFNRLERLSPTLFHNLFSLQVLNLESNEISLIEANTFVALKNLHTLILSHNKLTTIDATALNGLFVLSTLSLDNNAISGIHHTAFSNCSSLKDLNLNGNSFSEIPTAVQNLTMLKTVDLGENKILGLDSARLIGLPNLYGLRLTGNQIVNVSKGIFNDLGALKVVNLARNQIHSVEQGTFDNNYNLQAVRLDANYLTDISDLFSNLPNLLWLNVSDNRLTWFDYSVIPSQLMWLDVHKNEIVQLENVYGRSEFRLQTLDASFNRISGISANSIPDSVENLYLNDNVISMIEPNTFYGKRNLSRVDIFMNQIETLELAAFQLQPVPTSRQLPEFYMAGNPYICDCRLEWIINLLSSLRQHPVIMDLDSLYCQLPYHQLATADTDSPQVDDLEDDEEDEDRSQSLAAIAAAAAPIPNYFKSSSSSPPSIVMRIKDVLPDQFLCPYTTHCFNQCHCCDFEACDCQQTCPSGCQCYHDNAWTVNVVDCASSERKVVPSSIPMDSTELHLDGNSLRLIPSHVLIGRKNLERLYLNSSAIETIMNNSFTGLKKVVSLHLQGNYLREIRGYEFEQLENLRELFLHRNQLSFIAHDAFVHLQSLEVLTLSENRLTRFAIWNLSWNPRLTHIGLGGNPWSCECDFVAQAVPFIHTILAKLTTSSSSSFLGTHPLALTQETINLNCVQTHSGKSWPLLHMNATYCSDSSGSGGGSGSSSSSSSGGGGGSGSLHLPPNNSIFKQGPPRTNAGNNGGGGSNDNDNDIFPYLPSLLAIGAVLLFVSSVFLAVCRKHNCLRDFILGKSASGGGGGGVGSGVVGSSCCREVVEDSDSEPRLFDCYIAYSLIDEAWVSQILATNLQQQHMHHSDQPYRICLHYRDFVMTAYIADTIVEAVESSKRTVVVLSKNFLNSEWTSFEFKSALHTAIRGNMKNRLIIVTLGDISTRDLDPGLRVMLRHAVVLQANDKFFWEKMKNALPEPRPVSNATWRNHKSANTTTTTYYDVNERNNWLQPEQFPQIHPNNHQHHSQLVNTPMFQPPLPPPPLAAHHHHPHHQQHQQQHSHNNLQPILDNFHNSQCNHSLISSSGASSGVGGGHVHNNSDLDKTQYSYVE